MSRRDDYSDTLDRRRDRSARRNRRDAREDTGVILDRYRYVIRSGTVIDTHDD